MLDESEFYREDLTKYENRINWCLLGCLSIDALRSRILERLDLPPESVLRPDLPKGQNLRPDFAAYHDNKRVAYMEVELGDRYESQGKRYIETFKELRLCWIVGQPNQHDDLSLKEIAKWAAEIATTPSQTRANLRLLQRVIEDGLIPRVTAIDRREPILACRLR